MLLSYSRSMRDLASADKFTFQRLTLTSFWELFTRRTPPPQKKKEKDYDVYITITYQL
jgi:hypothetical protein